MSALAIRDARAEDAEDIAGVHVRSWQAAYRGLIDQSVLDGLSVDERASGWRRILAEPLPTSLGTLVAVRDDHLIGWASLGSGRDPDGLADGEVYGIYATLPPGPPARVMPCSQPPSSGSPRPVTTARTYGCSTATSAPTPSTPVTAGSKTARSRSRSVLSSPCASTAA